VLDVAENGVLISQGSWFGISLPSIAQMSRIKVALSKILIFIF
jgi:hypothetical protein